MYNNHLQVLKLCSTLFQRYSYESARSDDLLKVTEQVCGRDRNRDCFLRVRLVPYSWVFSYTVVLHDVALPQAVKEGGAHTKASLAVHAGFKNSLLHLQNCLNCINFNQINMTQKSTETVVKRLPGFLCVGEESVECLPWPPPI